MYRRASGKACLLHSKDRSSTPRGQGRRGCGKGRVLRGFLDPSSCLIHRSAWKGSSAKFLSLHACACCVFDAPSVTPLIASALAGYYSVERKANGESATKRKFKPLLRRAGLPEIRFHDLRHTCATLLLT